MKSELTSKAPLILIVPLLASLAACGGGSLQVRGAQFDLNGQEATLADQYTKGDPVQADAGTRCQYWRGRSVDATRGHAMGVVAWPPQHFMTLRQWTQARVSEVCGGSLTHEQQPDGVVATGIIDNEVVVATFTAKAKCREARVDDRGQPLPRQNSWTPCAGTPLSGAAVRLAFDDDQSVAATTDTAGQARFSLADVRWGDANLKSGQAKLTLPTDPTSLGSVDLTKLPQHLAWETEHFHADQLQKLEDIERRLKALGEPWTDDQRGRYRYLKDAVANLSSSQSYLSQAEQGRLTRAMNRITAVGTEPAYLRADAAGRARNHAQEQARESAAAAQSASPCDQQRQCEQARAPIDACGKQCAGSASCIDRCLRMPSSCSARQLLQLEDACNHAGGQQSAQRGVPDGSQGGAPFQGRVDGSHPFISTPFLVGPGQSLQVSVSTSQRSARLQCSLRNVEQTNLFDRQTSGPGQPCTVGVTSSAVLPVPIVLVIATDYSGIIELSGSARRQ